jgi:pyruvate formate lyase activating enzyme
MAQECRKLGLKVGIQTNGVFPETLDELIKKKLIDKISLDLKARWERYDNLLKKKFVKNVRKSLAICSGAVNNHSIQELEIVVTLFRGYEDEVQYIARNAGDIQLVLQQGIDRNLTPLSLSELKSIADQIGRKVKIRTREFGEVEYEGNRSRRFSSERQE